MVFSIYGNGVSTPLEDYPCFCLLHSITQLRTLDILELLICGGEYNHKVTICVTYTSMVIPCSP